MQDLRDGVAEKAVVKVLAAEKLQPGPATRALLERDLVETPREEVKAALRKDGFPEGVVGKVGLRLAAEIEAFHDAATWRWIARAFMIACFIGLAGLVALAW